MALPLTQQRLTTIQASRNGGRETPLDEIPAIAVSGDLLSQSAKQ